MSIYLYIEREKDRLYLWIEPAFTASPTMGRGEEGMHTPVMLRIPFDLMNACIRSVICVRK